MNRFRKRSDAKRPTQLQSQVYTDSSYVSYDPDLLQQETLPELPLASDFRASLILTDLSRRFTLLSGNSRESVSVDALRSRLADQRARRTENHISEEEEDMIIETLGLRPAAARSDAEDEYLSSVSTRSALSGSSSTASSKRYSNNLFGSGRFRDYSYMRSVSSMQSKTASLRTTDSTRSYTASVDGTRPVTPETVSSSGPEALSVRSAPLIPAAPYSGQPLSVAEYRLSKSLGPSALRRASLALEEAIKAIEEEGEDEIVMPRSGPRGSLDTQRPSPESREVDASRTSGVYEAGTAISSDRHMSLEPESPRSSPIPSRTVPGYIPGMPRPMTPRDAVEIDDQRCYSTTPRATSPSLPNLISPSPLSPSGLSSGVVRRDSNASPSRQSPRPSSPNVTSPMFIQRTPNGRYTPEGSESVFSGDFEGSHNSSVGGRRRPASPLTSNTYQPMAVPARPGTPSHVTWVPSSNGSSKPGHTRDPSWISDSSESPTRSLRSPALPDSPLIGPGHATINSFSSSFSSTSSFESPRPLSPMSTMDLGSPAMSTNRALRSPTPTQVANRSPTTGTFPDKSGSRRSSKQNPPSSPFTLGPYQPLVFSPIANSSRSSLESAGSSYHSWDGDQKDRTATLFSDADPQKPLWHNVLPIGEIQTDSSNSSPDDWEAEDVIMKYAGLKKLDFLAIQEKLVSAAIAKTSPDVPHRVPSLRRRRPSTSQSNYSLNGRIASPPQSPITAGPVATDQYSALLNSVVDSLQSSSSPNASISVDVTGADSQTEDISPNTRRNRDLAQVLFGQEDEKPHNLTISVPANNSNGHVPNSAPLNSSFPIHSPYEVPASSASANWPYQPSRNPSTPKLPSSALEHAELAREVQRKADAAMVALQKHPSNSNLALAPKLSAAPRKRISPNQISTPQLVSASTSVDTIPLPSPAPSVTGGQSKIGSRLKRLRGSLRTKPMLPTAEDLTPFPMELRSPPPVQTVRYDPTKARPAGEPIPASATEAEGFKVPVPSPPASAGPGLKGFMNRLRGKPRVNEIQAELESHGPYGRTPNLPPLNFGLSNSESASTQPPQSRSPPSSASTPTLHSMSLSAARSPTLPLYSPRHQGTGSTEAPDVTVADESQAIKQLFDAASNLGLDQGALSDLLARSGSTSSKSTGWTLLTRNNSTAASAPRPESAQSGEPSRSNSHRSIVSKKVPEGPSQPDHLRRPREGAADKNAVVRRTIIYPSESRASTIDLSVLIRKQSSRRKRASATSVSSRSVHDRVPTPPPPRAASGRRFSTDMASPPVPQLPTSTMPLQTDRLMVAPTGPVEKSYDSLYEMYSGEKPAGPSTEAPQGAPVPEPGQAVEVIEYANGETIWSIVNGLRDENDDLDGYASRASFASDYSLREGGEGVQVFFKEHGRRGSTSSFLSRKKTASKSRPETKVFYSSSAQIGRLIENISQGMEAGSFNILPNHPIGHSTTSSLSETDMNWTVEERLEHMLHGLR